MGVCVSQGRYSHSFIKDHTIFIKVAIVEPRERQFLRILFNDVFFVRTTAKRTSSPQSFNFCICIFFRVYVFPINFSTSDLLIDNSQYCTGQKCRAYS